MNHLLKEAEKYTIYITIFLLPIIFLPTFFNPFTTAKVVVLVLGVSLAFIFRLIRTGTSGSLEFNQGSFDFPVFLLMVVYLLSGIYASPNKMESFFLPGTATVMIAGGLLYFLVNQLEEVEKHKVTFVVLGSTLVLALTYILSIIGLFEHTPGLPEFMKTKNFTPQGALLPTTILLFAALPYGIGLVTKSKDQVQKVLIGCATALIGIALLISAFNMFSDRANFRLASFESSLSVTFDALKSSAVLGVGPSNYISAYTRFRPISSNVGDDWSARYTQARNLYFSVITETGFAGTFAIILLLIVLFKMFNNEVKVREIQKLPLIDTKILSLIILFLVLAIFPATSPEVLVLIFVGLALATKTRKFRFGVASLAQQVHVTESRTSKLPALIVITPLLVGIGYLLLTGTKVLAAERNYKVAIDHLTKNEGTQAYEGLQAAINGNPYVDRYHATYSQINFLLANAVAKKEKVSDADRQTIAKLVEQSIREAKATVALNPQRSGNWEILGNTYRNIMSLSKDAANFAIQSYSQAVVLDPLNPNLRISLGGIWYAIKNYDTAVDTFKLAVLAKPDHANARYNLASAYRENGNTDKAIAELKTVLTLVDPSSKDYETAKKDLEALESKKAAAPTTGGENLTTPPTNQPIINPGVKLPADAAPEISPTPVATPTPAPTATPTP